MREHDWDNRVCANSGCRTPLNGSPEFVLQVSTKHVRWFCNDFCLIEGQDRHYDAIAQAAIKDAREAGRP